MKNFQLKKFKGEVKFYRNSFQYAGAYHLLIIYLTNTYVKFKFKLSVLSTREEIFDWLIRQFFKIENTNIFEFLYNIFFQQLNIFRLNMRYGFVLRKEKNEKFHVIRRNSKLWSLDHIF